MKPNTTEAGIPWIWVTGGALASVLFMIIALMALIVSQGLHALWPASIAEVNIEGEANVAGTLFREEFDEEHPNGRALLRLGNRDISSVDFKFVEMESLDKAKYPEDLWYVERLEWGPFIGRVVSISNQDQNVLFSDDLLNEQIKKAKSRSGEIARIEKDSLHSLNARLELIRIQKQTAKNKLQNDKFSALQLEEEAILKEFEIISEQITQIRELDSKYYVTFEDVVGNKKQIATSQIVRAFRPNALGFLGKLKVYGERVYEFLTTEPREANSAGGVFPALFGTCIMTFLMSLAVLPFGVMAAVYMREIAKQGKIVSLIRIAVGNLAGVPSIVYGVFGLGFFCYLVGASIDELLFSDRLPSPTFGTGGILWASLTLALLTVPVVVVSTEEALAAVPRTLREASYGCGATRVQTLWRIVLPKALPGVMTGLILAMARGVGEVAPLLMTGVVKLAPALPVDFEFPFVHLERSFMHLGFHIYDLGFQSRSAESSRPMVFASTLLLIFVVLLLNVAAIRIRASLRKRFEGRGAF